MQNAFQCKELNPNPPLVQRTKGNKNELQGRSEFVIARNGRYFWLVTHLLTVFRASVPRNIRQ